MTEREVILVTGANGQLGMELRAVSSSFPAYDFLFLSREQLPIDEDEAVRKVFAREKPEYCINCAAYTAVDKAESETELAYAVNATAVGLLADTCKKYETRLIHISTDYVFNGQGTKPYRENDITAPVNVYGASKLEGERLASEYGEGVITVRTSWVYSRYGKNFVNTMRRLMKEKASISVVNDQFGAPTFAGDLAQAILEMISFLSACSASTKEFGGIYHYTNEGQISWYEFAGEIKSLIGATCTIVPVTSSDYPTAAKRPAWSVLDTQKIRDMFGIKLHDWRESLARCLAIQ